MCRGHRKRIRSSARLAGRDEALVAARGQHGWEGAGGLDVGPASFRDSAYPAARPYPRATPSGDRIGISCAMPAGKAWVR
jgi:hypothetical protein